MPEWQSQRGDTGLGELENKRGVPDVASFADPRNGFVISVSGKEMVVGGTSAAAPLWAGLIARINESLGSPVGYLNPRLYLEGSRHAFEDIKVGSNGKWSAKEGWDACTGLGRPRGTTLLRKLTGGPAEQTVRFAFEGTDYEIDLSAKEAAALGKQLAPYIENARKARRTPARRPGRTAVNRQRSSDIRAWASEHGLAVSDRGRIPAGVVEQYQAATEGKHTPPPPPAPIPASPSGRQA
jgi:hypothetical protein